MKKIIFAFLGIILFSCTSSYDKANNALENLKAEQNALDSLLEYPEYKNAVKKAKIDHDNGINTYVGEPPVDAWYSTDYVNYLKSKGDTATAKMIERLGGHQLMIISSKTTFEEEVQNVKDASEQLELIKKFDMIYVLKIEK